MSQKNELCKILKPMVRATKSNIESISYPNNNTYKKHILSWMRMKFYVNFIFDFMSIIYAR